MFPRTICLSSLLSLLIMTQMPHFHALSHGNRWTAGSTVILTAIECSRPWSLLAIVYLTHHLLSLPTLAAINKPTAATTRCFRSGLSLGQTCFSMLLIIAMPLRDARRLLKLSSVTAAAPCIHRVLGTRRPTWRSRQTRKSECRVQHGRFIRCCGDRIFPKQVQELIFSIDTFKTRTYITAQRHVNIVNAFVLEYQCIHKCDE